MGFDLGGLLHQYVNGVDANTHRAQEHFQQASDNAPLNLILHGLAAAFRSEATAPFPQLATQLFREASPGQQAGLLNQLVAGIGPATLASLLTGSAVHGLEQQLAPLVAGGGQATLSPEQASQLSADQVLAIARHAEQHDPAAIDRLSGYLAEHPALVATLGSAALSIALANMAEHSRG